MGAIAAHAAAPGVLEEFDAGALSITVWAMAKLSVPANVIDPQAWFFQVTFQRNFVRGATQTVGGFLASLFYLLFVIPPPPCD